ncbi:aspartic peptidase domain-containing protein [Lipomyces chichibuensis]|uniref:aspartic peptidase domain-containing protein n=1 Tax=Lipomyces chichibuensis TaxID=1546026 RepID=UPI003343638B
MRVQLSAAITAILVVSSTAATTDPGTVKFDIVRQKRLPGSTNLFKHRHRHRLAKRATGVSNTVQEILDNYDYLYYANVSVGTPGQNLRLQIDTGSSDIWVQSGENSFCQESSNPCNETGIFEPQDSSTFSRISDNFYIAYGDGSYAKGDYAYDTFDIGGAAVKNLTIAVATDANTTEGIMGIGYPTNEAIVSSYGSSYQYKNLPDLLVEQRFIRSRAYSLWLNDLEASTGSILFGGVDRAKYSGNLVELPIDLYTGESQPSEFFVTLDGVGYTNTDGSRNEMVSNMGEPVLLDCGTSFNYLPNGALRAIANAVSATYNARLGYYVQSCTITSVNASIDFYFGGVTIKVPLNEILYPAVTSSGRQLTFTNGQPVCLLTVASNSDLGVSILGDTFLRSAYVVYDLDNNVISLAQTVFNETKSDIVAIGTGATAIPGATTASSNTPLTLSASALTSAFEAEVSTTGSSAISLPLSVTASGSDSATTETFSRTSSSSLSSSSVSLSGAAGSGGNNGSNRVLLTVCVAITVAFGCRLVAFGL